MNLPYDFEIPLAYFEARVDKIVKELTKFHLSFVAFEMDSGISEYSSYSVVVIGHRLCSPPWLPCVPRLDPWQPDGE